MTFKEMVFDSTLGENRLMSLSISDAQKKQRGGRTGKTNAGYHHMMCTKESADNMPAFHCSATTMGDLQEYLMHMLRMYPGTFPIQNRMPDTPLLIPEAPPAVLKHAATIMVMVRAIKASPVVDGKLPGFMLTEKGANALRRKLSLRAALIWDSKKPSYSKYMI